ncbi:MAG: hypothetical protein M3203_06825 [Actinomycetota bacterium]|nr:hypothetical protein [Actinomycetota bacterium]
MRVTAGQGEGETLGFNERRAVDRDGLTIIVYGRARHHRIAVSVPPPEEQEMPPPAPADPRPTVKEITTLTEAERDALTALFHEYLEGRDDRLPRPESYGDAGALLPRPVAASAIRRRFERVVDRLRLAGFTGLEGEDLKRATAQLLIVNGLLTARDLRRLRRGTPPASAPDG